MTARKTAFERDMIDYPIALRQTKDRVRKIAMLRDFELVHNCIPNELLRAFGHSEYVRGWSAGSADAQGLGEEA